MMSLRLTRITHVSRSQNMVSDVLARFARVDNRTIVWLASGPPEVVELCMNDCNMATP